MRTKNKDSIVVMKAFRVTSDEAAKLTAQAHDAGMSTSAYIREALYRMEQERLAAEKDTAYEQKQRG